MQVREVLCWKCHVGSARDRREDDDIVQTVSRRARAADAGMDVPCESPRVFFGIPFFSAHALDRLLNEVVVTAPTIGSNVEEIQYKNVRFVMWDLGGQESSRASWSTYYKQTNAVMLVV